MCAEREGGTKSRNKATRKHPLFLHVRARTPTEIRVAPLKKPQPVPASGSDISNRYPRSATPVVHPSVSSGVEYLSYFVNWRLYDRRCLFVASFENRLRTRYSIRLKKKSAIYSSEVLFSMLFLSERLLFARRLAGNLLLLQVSCVENCMKELHAQRIN